LLIQPTGPANTKPQATAQEIKPLSPTPKDTQSLAATTSEQPQPVIGKETQTQTQAKPIASLQQLSLSQIENKDRILLEFSKLPEYEIHHNKEKRILYVRLLDTEVATPLPVETLQGRYIERAMQSTHPGYLSIGLTLNQTSDVKSSELPSDSAATVVLAVDITPTPSSSEEQPATTPQKTKTAEASSSKQASQSQPIATSSKTEPVKTAQADKPLKPVAKAKPPTTKPIKQISKKQQAENLHQQALTQLQRKNTDNARELLLSALNLKPDYLKARYTLAALLVNQGQMGEAQNQLEEGLRLQPSYAPFAMLYARLKAEQNKIAEAITVMEGALINAQRDAAYHAQLAALYQRQEQHANAVRHYGQALQLEPRRSAWWMGMGISLEHSGRRDDAITAYRQARAMGGLSPEALAYVESRLAALD
jgi:MSHA biogenesis protein MshN